jgi:hypothetical protein
MNKFKEKPKEPETKPSKPKKQNKVTRSVVDVVSGTFLIGENTRKILPFILFLSLMSLGYIANGYYAESKVRQLNTITKELKELRSEYIITKSDLMFISKQSAVAKAAVSTGLKESVVPPSKIVVKVSTPDKTD